MKAIVIGGTGATGAYLLQELLASDRITSVTALTRRAISVDHPRLNQQIVDFEQLEDVSISGDLAFSCLGTTRKAAGSKKAQWRVDHDYQLAFARMARKANVPVFTLMSSMGSDKNS
ncbi:MAG: semialdehyde dehydrogenase NAD-binding protein, partial [Candidatus Parvibacillus calidus]